MSIWAALLRGINVSGQKLIKMTELKAMFEDMGFSRVQTYIQSGNVLFEAGAEEPDALRRSLERQIQAVFGYDVPVVIRTPGDLERIITDCPYPADRLPEGESLYVALLAEAPQQAGVDRLLAHRDAVDEFRLVGSEIYIIYRNGAGRSKLTNTLFEKKLGVAATSRNWQTISKLAALGKAMEA